MSLHPLPRPNGHTQRRLEARRKLLVAADELFEINGGDDGGYERTTIDQIVERAGISRRSFFDHFDTKADVLLLDLKSFIAEHCVAIAKRPAEEPLLQAIPTALVDIGERFVGDPLNRRRLQRFSQTSLGGIQITDAAGRWEAAINTQLDIGEHHRHDDPRRDRLAVALAVTICRLATIEWLTGGVRKPPADYLRRACDDAADLLSSGAAAQRFTGQ